MVLIGVKNCILIYCGYEGEKSLCHPAKLDVSVRFEAGYCGDSLVTEFIRYFIIDEVIFITKWFSWFFLWPIFFVKSCLNFKNQKFYLWYCYKYLFTFIISQSQFFIKNISIKNKDWSKYWLNFSGNLSNCLSTIYIIQ